MNGSRVEHSESPYPKFFEWLWKKYTQYPFPFGSPLYQCAQPVDFRVSSGNENILLISQCLNIDYERHKSYDN